MPSDLSPAGLLSWFWHHPYHQPSASALLVSGQPSFSLPLPDICALWLSLDPVLKPDHLSVSVIETQRALLFLYPVFPLVLLQRPQSLSFALRHLMHVT